MMTSNSTTVDAHDRDTADRGAGGVPSSSATPPSLSYLTPTTTNTNTTTMTTKTHVTSGCIEHLVGTLTWRDVHSSRPLLLPPPRLMDTTPEVVSSSPSSYSSSSSYRPFAAVFNDDDHDSDDYNDDDDLSPPHHRRPFYPPPARVRHHWQRHSDNDVFDDFDHDGGDGTMNTSSIDQPRLVPPTPSSRLASSSSSSSSSSTSSSMSISLPTPSTTISMTSLPIEAIVRASSFLSVIDARSLSNANRELRRALSKTRCAMVDLWLPRMADIFPSVFGIVDDDDDDDGGGDGDGIIEVRRRDYVAFVDDRRMPIPAVSTRLRCETDDRVDIDAHDDDDVDVNLPLLAGLMPRRYPQRIDPRTLMTPAEDDDDYDDYDDGMTMSEDEDRERDIEDDDDEETLFMMMIFGGGGGGGVNDDHRRDRRRREASRRGREQQDIRRRLMRITRRSTMSTSPIALFRSYVTAVNARRISNDGGTIFVVEEVARVDDMEDGVDVRDDATMMLPVIRFVGDRVGTGERCVRSDHPFPPDCRRVMTAVSRASPSSSHASSSSSSSSSCGGHRSRRRMSGFLAGLVAKRGDDGASEESTGDDNNNDDNIINDGPPSSPGRLIMSKCKRGIVGRLASLRGGLKRASSISKDDDHDENDDDEYDLVSHPRPFVIPTVILDDARGPSRGFVVDVTPRLVAYFEVTIVRVRSSTTATAVDGVAVLGYNHRIMEDAGNRRHRQRRDGRRQSLNQAPAWMPMMMMPMYPFPVELISMMNAFEWDRMPSGAGGRGGPGGAFNHGAFREHGRRQHEMQRRRERERHVRRERREWEEQRHGRPQRGEIDARRVRHQDQQDQRRGHRHECVAIGLSTRYFSPADKMPGWDSESFGYHGDDGGVYHGRGDMLRRYGPSYGPGDTVGCGLDYASRRIFFVKNGDFLGYAFGDGCDDVGGGGGLSRRIIDHGLYPTVGVDTECPISVNFGERPFIFDLRGFASAVESGGGKC